MDRNEEVLMSVLLDVADGLPLYIKKWVVDKLYPMIRSNAGLYVIDTYGLLDPSCIVEMVDPILDAFILGHDVIPEYMPEILDLDVNEAITVLSEHIERIILAHNNLPVDD